MKKMSNMIAGVKKDSNKKTNTLYEKVNNDIVNEWPAWKKEAYNQMFAVSKHAVKVAIK